MAVKLSAISAHVRSLKLEVDMFNIELNISYYPGKFTPQYEDQVQRLSELAIENIGKETVTMLDDSGNTVVINTPQELQNYMVNILAGLLASWDITDDDGILLPTTPANIYVVPYPLLRAIMTAIKADMVPNEKN